jgi:hypothetical protein
MTSHLNVRQRSEASGLIHPEHQETGSIIYYARQGGIIAGGLAFAAILGVFFYLHLSGAVAYLSLSIYFTWAIASMTLVFASAITGMLIGVLVAGAWSKIHFLQHQHEAISTAMIEVSIRQAIRKVLPKSRRI